MPTHVINAETTDVQLPIFKHTTTLTDAQIKALPTTTVTILDTPGVGKIIVPKEIQVIANISTPYSGLSTGSLMIFNYSGGAIQVVDGVLINGDDNTAQVALNYASSNQLWRIKIRDVIFWGSPENQGITVSITDLANFTGGNAANKMTITICYMIIDL